MAATRSRAEKEPARALQRAKPPEPFPHQQEELGAPAIHEPAQKIHQVGTQQFRFDVELGESSW